LWPPPGGCAITAVVVALTACAFAAAGDHQTLASIGDRTAGGCG
jgi:hypothetical protein